MLVWQLNSSINTSHNSNRFNRIDSLTLIVCIYIIENYHSDCDSKLNQFVITIIITVSFTKEQHCHD